MYLLPQSSHHPSLYRNIPFGVALRLRRICSRDAQGVLPNKEVGGLDLTSSLEAKFGARSGLVHKIRGTTLGSYLKFRGQNLGYLSFIFLEAKFGAPTRISEAKFGAKPPPTS